MEIRSIILLMVFSPDWLISVPLSGVCKVYILGGIFAWTLKQWLAVGLSLAEVKFKRSYWIQCNWRFVHSNIRVWLRLFSASLVIFSLFSKFFGDLTGFSVISFYLKWLLLSSLHPSLPRRAKWKLNQNQINSTSFSSSFQTPSVFCPSMKYRFNFLHVSSLNRWFVFWFRIVFFRK